MLDQIQEHFAASGRTPKGRQALRSIFAATRASLAKGGVHDTSLERIATGARMSQAALRHYFPTRDVLLTRFFTAATEWFQAQVHQRLDTNGGTARDRLASCIGWHLEYMESVSAVFWFDASTFWLRDAAGRRLRNNWYQWLQGEYARLIGQMQPALGARERQLRAYTILTLVLGAWATHGRGSYLKSKPGAVERRQALLNAALELAAR